MAVVRTALPGTWRACDQDRSTGTTRRSIRRHARVARRLLDRAIARSTIVTPRRVAANDETPPDERRPSHHSSRRKHVRRTFKAGWFGIRDSSFLSSSGISSFVVPFDTGYFVIRYFPRHSVHRDRITAGSPACFQHLHVTREQIAVQRDPLRRRSFHTQEAGNGVEWSRRVNERASSILKSHE